MRIRPNRRILLAIVVVALLALFVPPSLNLESYRKRITGSLEQALGRPVTVDSVTLRLLPQPGFDLKNVVISEDPAFGAEPMLRAEEVTAGLRLSSLWRGRLEIAQLSFAAPSLNLVRASNGSWNIEALLQRASQTPSAPTGQSHAEARPRFPYIQAEGGRINFKIGQEKKVYSLSEADFSLWLASEDEWSFRMAAKPVRVDMNMSDTGQVKINGRFRRSANLQDAPLEVVASLQDGQLGQLTQFMDGRDRGWRGSLEINAKLSGTASALNVNTDAAIRDFRRYDIKTTEPLRLDAHCTAKYSHPEDRLSDLNCQMPLGGGMVRVNGSTTGLLSPSVYELSMSAEKVALQALVTLARHAKQDVPADLVATGAMDAAFTLRKSDQTANPVWTGEGHTSPLVLRSAVLSPELPLPSLTFATPPVQVVSPRGVHRRKAVVVQPQASRIVFSRFDAPLGASGPAQVSAWMSADGYELAVAGDSRIPRLSQVGRALGLRMPQFPVEGTAKLDVRVGGNWSGFAAPLATGSVQLHNVIAPMRGLNAPLQIANANLVLADDGATLKDFTARFTGAPVQFAGWMRVARNCDAVEQCPVQFDLQTDELSLDSLNSLLNAKLAKRAWYNVFAGAPQSPLLMRVQASGHIAATRLKLGSLSVGHVNANAQLASGKLVLTNLRADLLGGKHQGEWHADFTGAKPSYTGSGSVSRLIMAQLASSMRDNWAGGTVDASFKVAMSGSSTLDFATSMNADASFDWHNGVMHHVVLDGRSGPLQFKRFAGQFELRNGTLNIAESNMTSRGGAYTVNGTASLGRQLSLNMRNAGRSYLVSGSIEKPKVAPVAVLKR